ncbi:MAG: TolC family protein [Psychrobium sp.]|nr:TolC family protein [Psychrobium sp.]
MVKLITNLFVVLLLSKYSFAFETNQKISGGGALIDLHGLIELVLIDSYDLKKGELDLQILRQNVKRQLSEFYPRVDLRIGANNIKKFGSIPGIDSVLLQGKDDINTSEATVALSLNLYRGGYNINSYRAALLEQKFGPISIEKMRFNVAREVLQLYHNLKISILNRKKSTLELNVEKNYLAMQEIVFNEGQITKVELSQQKDKVDELKRKESYFTYEAQSYNNILLGLIGRDEKALSKKISVKLINEKYVEVFKILNFNIVENYDLLGMEQKYKLSKFDIEKIKSKYLPKIDLSSLYVYSAFSDKSVTSAFNDLEKDKSLIGITLSWNIFEGFATNKDYKIAKYKSRKLKLDILNKKRNLINEKIEIELNINKFKDEIDSLQGQILQVQHGMVISQEEFNNGQTDRFTLDSYKSKIKILEVEIKIKFDKLNLLKVDLFGLGQGVS